MAIFVRNRKGRFIALALALLLYGTSIAPVPEFLLSHLEDAYPIPSDTQIVSCDAYVVLGGGIRSNVPSPEGQGALSGDSLFRVIEAYRTYRLAPKPVILSGGKVFSNRAEADVAKTFLVSLGVRPDMIVTEGQSTDTRENALYVKKICERMGIKRILLITSAFHMRRSVILFGRFFRDIIPDPTGFRTSRRLYTLKDFLPSAANMEEVSIALKEYMGIMFYKIVKR